MLTREDYLNLAAVVSMAKVEGLTQASWVVVTHQKLLRLADPQPVEEPVKLTEE